MIPIKTDLEINKMREASAIAATVLDQLAHHVEPGITTYELDQLGKKLIEDLGAKSACFNYSIGTKSYPGYICVSVNDEVVHGIGSLKRVLKQGDIVSLDVSVVYNGYVGDNARTVIIEPVSQAIRDLVRFTEESLYFAIDQARPGNHIGHISYAVQSFVETKSLRVVRDFVGHGIGKSIHEEPQIPNFIKNKNSIKDTPLLKPGMTLAIEPMVNLGSHLVHCQQDGWTIVTKDGKPSAHFEHTVLVTESAPEILTVPQTIEQLIKK